MPGLRVRLFGRSSLEVNGQPVKLTPTAMLVLIRLVIADGGLVTVDELCRDVWSRSGAIDRDDRVKVQKRILEIRGAVDREHRGETSQFLRTERGRVSAYRLTLSRDAIDVFEFSDLIAQARRAAPELKVDLLRRATALWSGAPLADAADQDWAAQTVRQLHALRRTALRELMHAYELVGRHDDALDTGQQLSWELPDDGPLAASLAALSEQVRVSRHKRVFREGFADPDIAVVVMAGDLFTQDDANLVVGFCDTFDTDIDRNIVISGESAQGMLLQQLYGGDRDRLDRDLKAALARVPKAFVESRSAKPRGKLTRYPVGTVATLHHATRRVFAVAYSRMGNDLVAQSSVPELRASLENLWDAVYLYGQLKPVAMPLIGSGLSRTRASYDDLLAMIVSSFTASSRRRYISPELRIIIHQPAFERIRVAEILKSVREDAAHAEEGKRPTDDRTGRQQP